MNYKMIAIKFSMSLLLAGVMLGNAAWAESHKIKEISSPSIKLSCHFPALEYRNVKYGFNDRLRENDILLDTKDAVTVTDDEYIFKNHRISRVTGKAIWNADPEGGTPVWPGACQKYNESDRKF